MLRILYRDPWMIAIHKPAGLLVHRSQIDRYETRNAMHLLRDQIGDWVYPVHRLDKPVSGVLLFALNPDTARGLTAAFTEGLTQKSYLALVRGYCPESGTIDYPLKEELDEATDALACRNKAAQEAITEFTRLGTTELAEPVGRYATARYSLVGLTPLTGRKHQLRRHMKHIFHPIVGDTTHGDGVHNRFFREHFLSNQLMLASIRLEIKHPTHGEPLTIETQPDSGFIMTLEKVGLCGPAMTHQCLSDNTRAEVTNATPWL
jgi:tRNA pseudouridine65 synthase